MNPPDLGPQPPPPPKKLPNPRPLTVAEIGRLDDAALNKVIDRLQQRPQLPADQAQLLKALLAEQAFRDKRARERLEVDPALIPLRPVPDPPLIGPIPEDEKNKLTKLIEYLIDFGRGRIDAQPPGIIVSTVEGTVVGSMPARIFNWWLGGPLNSGGDVLSDAQLKEALRKLTDQERRALVTMLLIAQAIGKGQAGVVPMDKRDP